jgi:hypothetical protein
MSDLDHLDLPTICGGNAMLPICTFEPDDYQIGGAFRCFPQPDPFWPTYWI